MRASTVAARDIPDVGAIDVTREGGGTRLGAPTVRHAVARRAARCRALTCRGAQSHQQAQDSGMVTRWRSLRCVSAWCLPGETL